ncbi:MAG: hypothetical protein IK122_01460 [Alphaproteobacteria bacterium]|nr:hypothetical protein [Alphaproteobacteria bacterium]
MKKLSEEFCCKVIRDSFPGAKEIRIPSVPGHVAKVFIFDVDNTSCVCRFNEKSLVLRNQKLTKMLCDYGIPIKQTQAHVYQEQYFESYEYDPHKTLMETMPNMSEDEIISTYKSALRIQARLASFPIQEFNQIGDPRFMDVYKITLSKCINNIIAQYLYRTAYKLFSVGKNVCVAHSDLTPANMLVSDNYCQIVRFIDFDAISICNENLAVFSALRLYPLSNTKELVEYYQDISGHKLNYRKIMFMLNLFKRTLELRKQLNNITCKQH